LKTTSIQRGQPASTNASTNVHDARERRRIVFQEIAVLVDVSHDERAHVFRPALSHEPSCKTASDRHQTQAQRFVRLRANRAKQYLDHEVRAAGE
jgi:transcriptional regulator of NAD metabolism